MTRDDIIRMAREAGASFETAESMFRFAALVAAAEREACAKVCEEIEDEYRERESLKYAELKTDAQTGASDCAYRIRARGDIKISPQCCAVATNRAVVCPILSGHIASRKPAYMQEQEYWA